MKILMLAISLDLGGQSVHLRNLAKGLIERGHTVAVAAGYLAAGRPLGEEFFTREHIEVIHVKVANFGAGLPMFILDSAISSESLSDVISRFNPDIVHLHAITLALQAQIAKALDGGRAVIVSTFHNEQIDSAKKFLGRAACRLTPFALGHRIMAISQEMDKLICQEIGAPPTIIRQIANAADDRQFVPPTTAAKAESRARFGIHDDDFVVCSVGRLEARKNQRILIAAVDRLIKQGIKVRLLLAGDSDDQYRQELMLQMDALRCNGSISLIGFQEDARPVYWAADANALVSLEEGFGLVVIEAAMTSLPTIRSTSAGADDQVTEGETGFLVDATNIDSVAEALHKMQRSQQLRRYMGDAANRYARSRYTIQLMAEQVEAVYREAIDASRSPSG